MAVRNNLEEQLAKFKDSLNSTMSSSNERNASCNNLRKFSFKNVSSKPLPLPNELSTQLKSSYSNTISNVNTQLQSLPKPTAAVAPVTNIPQSSMHPNPLPPQSPVKSHLPVNATSFIKDTIGHHYDSSLKPPSSESSPNQLVLPQRSMDGEVPIVMESKLSELQEKRLQVMDDICDILNDVSASVISTVFGPSAGLVQKKLAIRRKLLSQETNLMKVTPPTTSIINTSVSASSCLPIEAPPTSSPESTREDCHQSVTAVMQDCSNQKLHTSSNDGQSPIVTKNMSHDSHVTVDLIDNNFEEWEEIENYDDDDDEFDDLVKDMPGASLSAGYYSNVRTPVNISTTSSSSSDRSTVGSSPFTRLSTNSCVISTSSTITSSTTNSPAFTRPFSNSELSVSNNATLTGPSSNSSSFASTNSISTFARSSTNSNSGFTGPSTSTTSIDLTSTCIDSPPRPFKPAPPSTPLSRNSGNIPSSRACSALTRDNSAQFSSSNYPHSNSLREAFRSVFGLKQFRPKQLEAVNAAILGEDCFVLMPTGGGKSLCYQLPALIVPGITIVISPLRSLIQDQVQKLCSLEIPACHLSGEMSQDEELCVYTELSRREPGIKLLYVTPEKLVASQKLINALQSLFTRQKLARFVVDEAHCISSWGHDFRPDYKRLSELRSKFPNVPMMALTATATPRVQADILNQLNMNNTKWFTQSFNRTNLIYSVVPKKPKKVTQDIIDLIKSKFRNQSGIIYCLSRRDCEVTSMELNQAGIPSAVYHAGLQDEERSIAQNRWLRDANCKVVCATIAFGMGIDKPDVRFVIHHTIAKSVEGYYQESGRAGRDGRPAYCILYYSYGDMSRIRRLLMMEDTKTNLRQNMDNLFRMIQYCENESDCRRLQLLEYFAERFSSDTCRNSSTPCDNCQSHVPHSTEDVSDLVKVIVQSLQRIPTKDQYTIVQHLEALRGGNSTRQYLVNLPYYKRGLELSKHDLERLLHMMVLKDIICEDLHVGAHGNVISYVKTGVHGNRVLRGLYGRILLKVKSKSSSARSSNVTGPSTEDDRLREECYQELKGLRTTLASELGKNPEVIMAVTTLQDMSQKLPITKEEMLNVQGMTEAKWKNSRGEEFLKVTLKYSSQCTSNKASLYQETISPFFSRENNENNPNSSLRATGSKLKKNNASSSSNGENTGKRNKVAGSGMSLKRKNSKTSSTNPGVLEPVSCNSEDEFEQSAPKKRLVSKQTRLPGFLTTSK